MRRMGLEKESAKADAHQVIQDFAKMTKGHPKLQEEEDFIEQPPQQQQLPTQVSCDLHNES